MVDYSLLYRSIKMAVQYNGTTFTVKSAYENAIELLTTINAYLVTNEVKDSKGLQAVIYVNYASPIWLIIFAVGSALSVLQGLVQAASDSLTIANCSDNQLLNLAEIAGITRLTGTKTILFFTVTADALGPCTVAPENLINYIEGVDFVPATTTLIPAGTSAVIEALSSVVGSYVIVPNALTSFKVEPAHTQSLNNASASIPGTGIESYTELRSRLQGWGALLSSLDSLISALRTLPGITHCNVFFNPSTSIDLTLPGGIVVKPRNARIIVYGGSSQIAATFYQYSLLETEGAESQNYITKSNQLLPVYYDLAILKIFYIKVIVLEGSGGVNYGTELYKYLLPASGSKLVGLNYSQSYLNTYLNSFPYAEILGVYVSMDNIIWEESTDLAGNEVGIFSTEHITIEEKEL